MQTCNVKDTRCLLDIFSVVYPVWSKPQNQLGYDSSPDRQCQVPNTVFLTMQ